MTPLLPRAPISDPCAAALSTDPADDGSMALVASSTAERSVKYMFDPVSPSGTGKTLRSLISSWLACRAARAPRRAASSSTPPVVSTGSWTSLRFGLALPATVVLEMDDLDVDVDGDHRQPEGRLD